MSSETWPQLKRRQFEERRDLVASKAAKGLSITQAASELEMTRPALDSYLQDHGLRWSEMKIKQEDA